MERRNFIKKCALLGLGTAFLPHLISCEGEDPLEVKFNGKVLIVGAGAAGMMAAYMLQQYGVDYQLIEAGSEFGGRVKRGIGFADFPIDLGAEWIHTNPSIFARLINNRDVNGSVELIPYNPQTISTWNNGRLTRYNWASAFYGEYKFKRTTWFDFFDQYIIPSIAHKTALSSPVTQIDYSAGNVVVTDSNNNTYQGDKVLVTVPMPILRNNSIQFTPALPTDTQTAINDVDFPPGIKIFIEFSQRFYPDLVMVGALTTGDSEQLYYDAAFKKASNKNIMCMFYVGDGASDFTDLPTDSDIIDRALEELDEMFEGQASQYYVQHITQNWSAEPYIQGSYSHYGNERDRIRNTLTRPLDGKVYFAGEALAEEDYSTVHGAGLSGFEQIEKILEGG